MRRFIAAALVVLAAITLGASLSPSLLVLLIALALYGPASGCAVATAEGALVEAAPEARERTLARITLAGTLGDLTVPALLAVIGWREAFGIAAALALGLAIVIGGSRGLDRERRGVTACRQPGGAQPGGQRCAVTPRSEPCDRPIASDDEEAPAPRLRDVLRNEPAVLAWSLADLATNLMDEVLCAFVVVHVGERAGGSPASLSLVLGALIAGGLAGLALLDRLLARIAPMRVLAFAGALSIPTFAALVMAREPMILVPLAFVLGALVSTFHPIVKARAYAALPGHPGVVNAVVAALGPLEIGAALLLGELARALGSHVALGALGVVPASMVLVALFSARGGWRT